MGQEDDIREYLRSIEETTTAIYVIIAFIAISAIMVLCFQVRDLGRRTKKLEQELTEVHHTVERLASGTQEVVCTKDLSDE